MLQLVWNRSLLGSCRIFWQFIKCPKCNHSHTASENLLVSPLEGKLQTTISTVVEWHTRIHSTTVDILTLLLWNEIIVCHTTTVDIPLLLWNEFILCHTTTHCGMTKFSLSLWECYIRTEEKCGKNKFLHSRLRRLLSPRLLSHLWKNSHHNSPQYGYSSFLFWQSFSFLQDIEM